MKSTSITILIADIYINIDISKISDKEIQQFLYKEISTFYQKELVQEYKNKPDFTVYYIAHEEYDFIKKHQKDKSGFHYYLKIFTIEDTKAYVQYYSNIAQFQHFLKMILQTLLGARKGFILHTSAITDGKYAYLFLGPNGIGKSTIVENLSGEFTPYADDMLIVKKINQEWFAYQLPLEKKHYKKNNHTKIPIRALCYLQQHKESHLQKISSTEASKKLLDQLIRQGVAEKNVTNLFEFLSETDHYDFYTPKATEIEIIRSLVKSYR